MLQSLHISNYALIDKVEIEFSPGLNIITGETGAGKSIMLDALSLLLGDRADQRVIRDRSQKSIIEATFAINDNNNAIKQTCAEADIECYPEEVILRRELSPSGRSRAFVNDSPVTLPQLRAIAIQLVDVHSQHQNLLLATPAYQLQIIDSMAGNLPLLASYSQLYQSYKNAVARYRRARRDIQEAKDDEQFTRFQLDKINEINPLPGEQEELERERQLLSNLAEVKQSLAAIKALIGDNDSGDDPASRLRAAADYSNQLADTFADATQLAQRLTSAQIEISDIADTFADYADSISADPGRLEYVEQRLDDITSLLRRHKVESVEALIEIRDALAEKLSNITHGDTRLRQLEQEARQAKNEALEVARKLSDARRNQSVEFAQLLRERASTLGMANLVVDIKLTETQLSPTGIDNVEFLFAFNKNQTPLPVEHTASGGEISRLMLTIKSIIAQRMSLPTIIFDEIDTGVSGQIALRMGQMMTDIARHIQVIAITHLPQVASKGSTHFKVYKEDDENSTITRIRSLNSEQRIGELAAMLSGNPEDPTSLAAAKAMLTHD